MEGVKMENTYNVDVHKVGHLVQPFPNQLPTAYIQPRRSACALQFIQLL
jgi:hypothetical protein